MVQYRWNIELPALSDLRSDNDEWAFCARLWPAHLHTPTDKVVRNRETLLCKSGRGMGKSKNQHDAGQILRPISSKLLPVINMQFRTLRTTPCSTIMHDGIASASAVSCQDNAEERFKNEGSPKTTKIKVASVEQLKELVLKKDVVGLRKVLSKELWPSYRRLKTFAAELLEVFVTCGKDTSESLFHCSASECNRVVLPNSVILQLLTRILTEKGLKATIDYAHYYRNLFLVKSPPDGLFSMHHTAVAEILFTEAFKKNDLPRIQDLCDTLIDLGFLNNSSVYLRAVVKAHLQSNCFDDAFNLWYKNAQKYRAKEGCDLLIRHTILERNLNDVLREKRLRNIFEKLNEVGAFHDGLAELVIELLKVDMTCEAELVFRRQNLPHIEHFATALLSTLLEESCSRNTRKYLNHKLLPEGGLVKDPQESNHRGYIKSLLAVWQPRCRRRQEKGAKKFKANIKELQGLMYATQNVWFDVAAGNNDMESLKRLRIWIMKYNINESGSLKKRLEDFCTKSNVNFK
uniref:Uncharacterized protein n=1 Tax=Setaria digitata TaxID=48799 RepID=A0A915PQD2_9BILA